MSQNGVRITFAVSSDILWLSPIPLGSCCVIICGSPRCSRGSVEPLLVVVVVRLSVPLQAHPFRPCPRTFPNPGLRGPGATRPRSAPERAPCRIPLGQVRVEILPGRWCRGVSRLHYFASIALGSTREKCVMYICTVFPRYVHFVKYIYPSSLRKVLFICVCVISTLRVCAYGLLFGHLFFLVSKND